MFVIEGTMVRYFLQDLVSSGPPYDTILGANQSANILSFNDCIQAETPRDSMINFNTISRLPCSCKGSQFMRHMPHKLSPYGLNIYASIAKSYHFFMPLSWSSLFTNLLCSRPGIIFRLCIYSIVFLIILGLAYCLIDTLCRLMPIQSQVGVKSALTKEEELDG